MPQKRIVPSSRHDNPNVTYWVGVAIILCVIVFGVFRGLYVKYAHYSALIQPPGLPIPTRNSRRLKIPIVMYHYVEYLTDPNDTKRKSLSINPNTLEAELRALNEAQYRTFFVREVPRILDGSIPYTKKNVVLTFDDGYSDFYTLVLPLLKKYHVKATVYVINHYIGRTGFLSQQQLEQIRDSGLVEIGAHTLDHAYLKDMTDETAFQQMRESKVDLEKRLGIRVQTVAYPYGAFSARTLPLTRKAGFSAAVSVIPGAMQTQDNILYLYRIRSGYFGGSSIVGQLEQWAR